MYNCEKQIVRVLAQLDKTVCEYISAVIVVNNRSTDNGEQAVKEWLKANRPAVPVTLLRNDENYGLGGAPTRSPLITRSITLTTMLSSSTATIRAVSQISSLISEAANMPGTILSSARAL